MNLVNINRLCINSRGLFVLFPLAVVPLVAVKLIKFCGILRTGFHMKTVRVAFHKPFALFCQNRIFISIILFNTVYFTFPNSAVGNPCHNIFAVRPVIKITCNGHAFSMRRPYPENNRAVRKFMRAEKFISSCIISLMKKVNGNLIYIGFSVFFCILIYIYVFFLCLIFLHNSQIAFPTREHILTSPCQNYTDIFYHAENKFSIHF